MLSTTENQEARKVLVETLQQTEVFAVRGPASAITRIGTASEFLADGWSTETVGRVVRAARTKQDNNGKECAEQDMQLCIYIRDWMPTFGMFPATSGRLEEGERSTEKTELEDDQDEEKEQSLADSLPMRRQVVKGHENMGYPSNRTLVRLLRFGGAKRRIVLAAAKHRCGVCEAQTSSWPHRKPLTSFRVQRCRRI